MSSFSTLARAREVATGSKLDVEPPDLTPVCASDVDLDRLISDYYQFLSERLVHDVAFLGRFDAASSIERFRRLIYNLRTASQHTDNPTAEREAKRWRAKHDSPQVAADALGAAMGDCLSRLAAIAVAVTRNPVDAQAWFELVAVETGAIFAGVESDLGLRFSPGQRRRRIRQVEGRLKVSPSTGDHRAKVAEYCVQEMLSDRGALPVPYSDVLDSLGLLGDPRAGGAVLLAYSVAAIAPNLSGGQFLTRVEEIWLDTAAI